MRKIMQRAEGSRRASTCGHKDKIGRKKHFVSVIRTLGLPAWLACLPLPKTRCPDVTICKRFTPNNWPWITRYTKEHPTLSGLTITTTVPAQLAATREPGLVLDLIVSVGKSLCAEKSQLALSELPVSAFQSLASSMHASPLRLAIPAMASTSATSCDGNVSCKQVPASQQLCRRCQQEKHPVYSDGRTAVRACWPGQQRLCEGSTLAGGRYQASTHISAAVHALSATKYHASSCLWR